MIDINDTIYWHNISLNIDTADIWSSIREQASPAGQFYIDISKRINPGRFVTRNGEWSLPWKQELLPGYEMPVYNPNYSKSFDQVTNERAIEIKQRITHGEKFAVMFSGGIDSTVIMAALIKNLTVEELKSITVCCSVHTMLENPTFFEKFIHGKFDTIDSRTIKYDDLIERGFTPITADEGDCIFGTMFGLNMYNNFEVLIKDFSPDAKANLRKIKFDVANPDVHYSRYKDLIIKHFGITTDPDFGRLFYEKCVKNVETASVPINSLHDFFWWLIFNIKYLNCAVRGALYFNDRIDWQVCMNRIVNWFGHPEYQRWSMANNNNGQKIRKTQSTYKWAAREYIYDLDKNDWYKFFKIKLESLYLVVNQQPRLLDLEASKRPNFRAGLTKNYKMLYLQDQETQDFFKHHLANYQQDW
jgi:hypothetical protein